MQLRPRKRTSEVTIVMFGCMALHGAPESCANVGGRRIPDSPNPLIKVAHHYQPLGGSFFEHMSEARQILPMVFPLRFAFQLPSSLGSRALPRNTNPNNRHLPNRGLCDAGHKAAGWERVDSKVIDLLPRFLRPQQYLPPPFLDRISVVWLAINRVALLSPQLRVRLGETYDIGGVLLNAPSYLVATRRSRSSPPYIPVD